MILVSGANGFVGRALVHHLSSVGASKVRASSRKLHEVGPAAVEQFVSGDISDSTDWRVALSGVDVVVHTAALTDLNEGASADTLAEFRRVNTDGTLNFAHQAAECGVKRFIFISSIKVNGEETEGDSVFTEKDLPAPADIYATSKYEAEKGLRELASSTDIDVVIIRPVVVYGPGVKGNFYRMMKWLKVGVPLPFGAIYNRRSLISVDNLVSLITTCLDHPAASNQTFLASDGRDLSTTELLKVLGESISSSRFLFPVPVSWINRGAALLGKQSLSRRLCGSLRVDISKAKEVLGWVPPVMPKDALRKTALNFLKCFS